MKLRVSHAASILPEVVDTFPSLLVWAGVTTQRFHQGFQPPLIELIIARLDPWLAFRAFPINDLAHLAEVFFGMETVQNLRGLGK